MAQGRCMVGRSRKRCKRCCINFKRCLKRVFTCRAGRMRKCRRRMKNCCKKMCCNLPCCTRFNLCESCRKCRRWARRCVCRPAWQGRRRVAHVEYYKVKKRRRIATEEQIPNDHSQVFYCSVSSHSKSALDKNTKDSAETKSNHEGTSKSVKSEGVDEGTSTMCVMVSK